jgi:hypothetical protein
VELAVNEGFTAVIPADDRGGTAERDDGPGSAPLSLPRQERPMSVKHIRPFLILGVAGVLIAACGGEQQVDTGAERPAPAVEAPPVAAFPEGWPLTADGAIRRELAKLEAVHAAD